MRPVEQGFRRSRDLQGPRRTPMGGLARGGMARPQLRVQRKPQQQQQQLQISKPVAQRRLKVRNLDEKQVTNEDLKVINEIIGRA